MSHPANTRLGIRCDFGTCRQRAAHLLFVKTGEDEEGDVFTFYTPCRAHLRLTQLAVGIYGADWLAN